MKPTRWWISRNRLANY
uniref:Uncharacterized protein n=1 Tax=Anguilla anguilla TaxID=7936 RepID=A0A0E9UEN7_ANGAN